MGVGVGVGVSVERIALAAVCGVKLGLTQPCSVCVF